MEQSSINREGEILNLLLDASPMFIEIWDENLKLVDCNNRFLNLYGISSKKEFIEKYESLSPLYQPCGVPSIEKNNLLLKLALQDGRSYSEWMHLTLDGQKLPVEIHFVRIALKDKTIIVGYNHDLRMIEKAMIEKENSEAKGRFLARMSHEIRTPITAVLGVSEIQLQNNDLPADIEESFTNIHNSALLLLNIINDILDLSKIEAGKMALDHDEYDVASMINDVSHMHQNFVGDKGVEFNLHVDEKIPAYLIGDAFRIRQIVSNLLSNAFKYTDAGSVNFSVDCIQQLDNDVKLGITINDTGFGMTKEQLEILLDGEYTRFHDQSNRNISGTGLGIPIVLNLLKMMSGQIEIESEVGKGTKITVLIPQRTIKTRVLGKDLAYRLQQFEESSRLAANRYKFTPKSMPYGSVLVVDDIASNLYVAKGLLAFYNLHIETCQSGFEAIEKIKQGRIYDIVFMDHMMPGMDGVETMREMRYMGYSEAIVALTANALLGQEEDFLRKGFDGFISKPIQTTYLNNILLKFIKDRPPPDISDIEDFLNDSVLTEKLMKDFAKRYKNAYNEIKNTINIGDFKAARLSAHSLKGAAGLICESALVQAAEIVEQKLANEETPENAELSAMEAELTKVLKRLPFYADKIIDKKLDKKGALTLFGKLKPLLQSGSADCLELLDELRAIPETAVLARQIDDFDFDLAIKTLETLTAIIEEQ